MTDQKAKPAAVKKSSFERTNLRSTIAFPYLDLDIAIEVAQAIFQRAGINTCPLDELAAELGQTTTSGNFKLKTSTCRLFGFADKDGQSGVRLTDLGVRLVENHNLREVKATAFLNVPLYAKVFEMYRGRLLPPSKALEREMQSVGVSAKQTDKARHAFQRSAKQAGFFESGEDRLVRPRSGAATTPEDESPLDPPSEPKFSGNNSASTRNGAGSDGGSSYDLPRIDPIILGLLRKLPEASEVWPIDQRKLWLEILENTFNLIYEDGNGTGSDSFD